MDADTRAKMPASKATFETYVLNIDISSFNDDDKLDNESIKSHHGMLSMTQLDSISKESKITYDERINGYAKNFYRTVKAHKLYKYPDSLIDKNLDQDILNNFNINNQTIVIDGAKQLLRRSMDRNKNQKKRFKDYRKRLNLYDYELGYRISFSLACLVLFFIGAPIGSIIRKGGFGLPLIMAILIFVIYFFISQLGKNLAEESAITTLLGSWLSTLVLLPFGFLLTRRATQGMGIFNIDNVFENIQKFFKKFVKTGN